jgi:methionyl-tRNA synthetase
MDQFNFVQEHLGLISILALWTLPWKGVAMWKAAQLSHKGWFVAIFLLNTLAILDILYIFVIAKKYKVETIVEK